MEETHVCVVDRDGAVMHEAKTASTPEAIAASLAKAPTCRRVVFETGRMAPTLYHGLVAVGLPVVCIESRHAYQALKSLATHKTVVHVSSFVPTTLHFSTADGELSETFADPAKLNLQALMLKRTLVGKGWLLPKGHHPDSMRGKSSSTSRPTN
jgi:hypothetical protein